MRLFSALYRQAIKWSKHSHAPIYLGAVSFIESSLFPIPPDVMLIPMAIAKPERAYWYATITTVTSVLGALLGYMIGMFFFHLIEPWLAYAGYLSRYQQVQNEFTHWGVWIMFIAGATPISFKLFTIAGGALNVSLLPFLIGSAIGRGARFYALAALIRWKGEKIHLWLERFVDRAGYFVLIFAVIAYGIYWIFFKR